MREHRWGGKEELIGASSCWQVKPDHSSQVRVLGFSIIILTFSVGMRPAVLEIRCQAITRESSVARRQPYIPPLTHRALVQEFIATIILFEAASEHACNFFGVWGFLSKDASGGGSESRYE